MSEFKKGQRVKGMYFTYEGDGYTVGGNCDDITISMEKGQADFMPWFEVWNKGKVISKYNGAYLAYVDP